MELDQDTNMFLCRVEDGQLLNLTIGQEVCLKKDGTCGDILVRVISITGNEAILEKLKGGL